MKGVFRILFLFLSIIMGIPPLAAQTITPWTGRWEGVLTQDEGGVVPEYKMILVLSEVNDGLTGYAEVWYGDNIYIKTAVTGTILNNFFIQLEDGHILNKKELKDQEYCQKTYQLVPGNGGKWDQLSGKWQGTTAFGKCVPGSVRLVRKTSRV